jgi:carboxyl-terminal processing protease
LARAVYDYNRGLVIGDSTHGKGTVQNLIPLGNQAIKVTIRKFYGPGGESTQKRGVVPHIRFPSVADIYEIGEKYYPGALPWTKIKAKPIRSYNMVSPYVVKLDSLSLLHRGGHLYESSCISFAVLINLS